MARRFAPGLTADDVRMSKQDPRVMGICIKTMAEADKVSLDVSKPKLENQLCFAANPARKTLKAEQT